MCRMVGKKRTIPRPESDHKTKPGEEECAAIGCGYRVEEGNGAGLLVDGVDFWRTPEESKGTHVDDCSSRWEMVTAQI